jgi:hypothetical protein
LASLALARALRSALSDGRSEAAKSPLIPSP